MGVSQPKKDRLAGKSGAADKSEESAARPFKHRRASGQFHSPDKQASPILAPVLQSVIDAMRDAVILYDIHGSPIYANAVTIEAYGYDPTRSTREEGMERLNFRGAAGECLTVETLPSTRALQGETVRDQIYRFVDAQGVERWIEVSALPVHVDGEQLGAVSIWKDVTEREMLLAETRSHQEALAQNRDMIAYVMKEAPVAIQILEGPEFRCAYVNAAFERLAAGRGKSNLMGRTVAETWPEARDQFLPLLQNVYDTGQPFHAEEMPVFVTIDDQPDSYYYTITCTPILDANRKTTTILCQVIDMTEQVHARQAIETERDQLLALLESIDDEVWFCDPYGNITLINDPAARGLGLNTLERGQKHPLKTEVLHRLVIYNPDGSTRAEEDAPLLRALRGEHWRGREIVRNPRTGQVMHRHANASPIRSKDGKILGAVAVVRDISDIQQAQQALIDSESHLRKSEAELRESESRFRGTFENAAVGMAHIGMDGRFLRVNPRLCAITGYTREALEAKTFQEITHPEDLQADLDLIEQMRAGEIDRYTMEKRYFREDGSIVWVNLTVGAQLDHAGQPDYLIVSIEDISDRKAAQRALQETVARLDYFINSNMVGIVIGDAEGRISEANDYYLNLIGYSRAEMEAKQVRWIDLTPPEHLKADRRALAELARRGACEPYEKEYIRKDGSRVWVLVGNTLLPDGQIMAFVLDDSARKRAENDLRAALYRAEEGQRTLEALMQYVPEGIAITGGPPDFRIRMASRYGMEMSGRASEDLLLMKAGQHGAAWGILNADGVNPADPEQLPLYRASHYGEEITGRELVVENADGRKIPVLVNAAPVRDEAGRIIAAINCWRDITERKEMEEALRARETMLQHYADELKRSNQDLENFAFVASHDLQEPLRKVTSFGDILKDRLVGQIDEATEDLLLRMINAGDRMKVMINDLLQLSRINTRGQAFVEVDLNTVATEVISDLEPAIERVGGQVLLDPLPRIEADPLQMRQLLQNLITNALKFHKPDQAPVVRVLAAVKNGSSAKKVLLTVADNGIGFDLEYFDRILQPFQRLHGRGEYEGTGIGLAICKRIVDRHHGQIRAESTLGEGSAFTITLPVKQKSAQQ